MFYNLIIYLYLLGVAIYSRFNEKVRKMWRGEREAFKILREKVDPQAKWNSCVANIPSIRSC